MEGSKTRDGSREGAINEESNQGRQKPILAASATEIAEDVAFSPCRAQWWGQLVFAQCASMAAWRVEGEDEEDEASTNLNLVSPHRTWRQTERLPIQPRIAGRWALAGTNTRQEWMAAPSSSPLSAACDGNGEEDSRFQLCG